MSPSLESSSGLTGAARTSRGDIFGRSGVGAGLRRRLPWTAWTMEKNEKSEEVI
jgi:hypothetical protein